jgi:UDP-N-acetylmuramoyl-L-alanyl-D-glutamate--2,6-diaminopimelate ligase
MQNALNAFKKLLGKNLTNKIRPLGHGIKGLVASAKYGFPSRKLKVIGITGTKGKTTTSTITGRLANLYGIKTGYITTAVINTGTEEGEFLNPYKMTSIDSIAMQKYLSEMVKNGCKWVVLEISSQGLEQNRHWGVFGFDEVVFLNIFPEHIEAHGSWENYKKAKGRLFKEVKSGGVFIANSDTSESTEMWEMIPPFVQTTISRHDIGYNDFKIEASKRGLFLDMVVDGIKYPTNFTAPFDLLNCYFAIREIAALVDIENKNQKELIAQIAPNLTEVYGVPGRMEWVVKNGQAGKTPCSKKLKRVSIMVDYAHEPESMRLLLENLKTWRTKGDFEQIIHVVSCDGVGRDDWKKPILGKTSLDIADYSILTTDNYEEVDNPDDIVDLLEKDLDMGLKNKKYFKIISRKEAFNKALDLACMSAKKTLIVSTGVGSEQGLTQPNGKMEWDERTVWAEMVSNFEK